MSSIYNAVMSDTVGVLYRATTGKTDPWSNAEINATGAQGTLEASRPVGQTDPGVGPQNAQEQSVYDAAMTNNQSTTQVIDASQPTDPCSLTSGTFDVSGCATQSVPSWVWWVAGGLIVLYILGPYVGLLERE